MTPPSGNDSGTTSGGGEPSGSGAPLTEATARRLVLALELLARRLGVGGDAAAAFANRDRTAAGQPHPAMAAMMAATAAGAAVANAAAGRASPVESAPASSQPAKVEVVKWSAVLPGGNSPRPGTTAPAIGGPKALGEHVPDAEVTRVVSGPKMLPAAAQAMWNPPKPPAPPRERERTREPAAAAPGKETGEGVAKALAAQFGRVLAPLMAFSTILNASNSGMGTFQKAVNVLATSLAPILLPPMILLSAGLLTVSDVVWNKVRPHLAMWAELITTTFVPAIEEAVGNLANLADAIEWVVNHVPGLKKSAPPAPGGAGGGITPGRVAGSAWSAWTSAMLTSVAPPIGLLQNPRESFKLLTQSPIATILGRFRGLSSEGGGTFGGERKQTDVLGTGGGPRQIDVLGPAGGARGPVEPMSAGDRLRAKVAESRAARAPTTPGAAGGASSFGGNLDMVLASLTKSLGPKAEYTTAAGAARARQLAGANGDPLDMKALLRAIESVRETTAGVRDGMNSLRPQPTPQVPPGGRNG